MNKHTTAVIGATGYTGVELVSILAAHPAFEMAAAVSREHAASPLSALYPALTGTDADLTLTDLAVFDPGSVEVVFLAVPHTTAMDQVATLREAGVRVIDLSADYRLEDAALYEQWYDVAHRDVTHLSEAVYALPELTAHDAITAASILACPGCYPTASALAAAPLLASTLAQRDAPVIVDAKSGISGAGRKATEATSYCAIDESVSAYKVAAHQHTPEIEQTLSAAANRPVAVTFTPHLMPMKRGILATVYIRCTDDATVGAIHAIYETAYADEPFITVLPLGQQPRTADVTGTNNAQIGVAFDKRTETAILTCAIDNLGKGASSQAVQVANIAFGLDQATGLQPFRSIV